MFGWEFPPHISGGLGTACYGLSKGLIQQSDLDLLFVVPKAYGDELLDNVEFIGANKIPIKSQKVKLTENERTIDYLEVRSTIAPYVDPEEFWRIKSTEVSDQFTTIQTTEEGFVEFSGTYGSTLYNEIEKYGIVAQRIAENNQFDIIHAHDWLTFPAGISAKKTSGKPLVIHVHATEFDRSRGNVNPHVFAIEQWGMTEADHIITVSNLTKQIVIEKYGIPESKITTVYNAVEPNEELNAVTIDKHNNNKIVTFLGRITMQKGPEYFIEAAYKVLQKMDNVRFVMAGSGDMMNKMIRLAAQRKIADRFHFTGFLKGEQVFELLKYSDVYIMPSVSEPFGISPLEAMQSNVPVIISKQSGVSEILKHAIKIDFWDIDAMADAIYGLLKYNALSNEFKTKGKAEVNSLKWDQAALKVRQIYDRVLTTEN